MKQGREIQVILAEDISRIDDSLNQLGWLLAALGTVGLIVLLALQIFIIRRGLSSLVDVKKRYLALKVRRCTPALFYKYSGS